MVRSLIKAGTANLMCKTGIDRILESRTGPVVVGYHRVVENFELSAKTSIPSMLVSQKMLEQHLDWIGRRYRFVDLNELGEGLKSGNDKIAAVTFDDGYQDFYDHALPLLQRKGIPAAIFVVTEQSGAAEMQIHDKLYLLLTRRRGWRPLAACPGVLVPDIAGMEPYKAMRTLLEALPLDALNKVVQVLEAADPLPKNLSEPFRSLSWESLKRIQQAGVIIGSHTRTHVLMTNESEERILDEVLGSKQDIELRLKTDVHHFAYPSGLFDAAAVNAVGAAGYQLAFTTCTHRSALHPWLTVPRTLLWENSSLNSQNTFSGPVLNCQIHHAPGLAGACHQHMAHGSDHAGKPINARLKHGCPARYPR